MSNPISFPSTLITKAFLFCALVAVFPAVQGLHAQSADQQKTSLFDHWYYGGESVIDMSVTTDQSSLLRGRKEKYQDALIEIKLPDGTTESYQGEIRLRGNVRRQICVLPPMKLKVKKKELTERGWLPHNKLKLVVPCRENSISEQYIVREFLTYRLYEHFSELSHRVQMVNLRLIDPDGKKDEKKLLAFIIEPLETLAARNDMVIVKREVYRTSFVEDDHYRRMAFFQYMVGNTDWSVPNHHNLEFLAGGTFQRLATVPYDFDYSGIVGTHYAVPHESLPIQAVTQRLYRGLACTEEEAKALIDEFSKKEEVVLRTVETYPLLDSGSRKDMMSYLEGFFKQLERAKGVISDLAR